MTAWADVRAALAEALTGLGLNVSEGDSITPPGAAVSGFEVDYHKTIGGTPTARQFGRCTVRVCTSRADPAAAYEAIDAALSDVPPALEKASGPWLQLIVADGGPGFPITIGNATYGVAIFGVEVYL
jgi:hypothetical protein